MARKNFFTSLFSFSKRKKQQKAQMALRAKTREILSTLDADQKINIGTDESPVYVTLSYDWFYYDNGVYVDLVEGYSTPRFGGKKHGCISWEEMYGYVCSLPPGKDGGKAWFRPRIAHD